MAHEPTARTRYRLAQAAYNATLPAWQEALEAFRLEEAAYRLAQQRAHFTMPRHEQRARYLEPRLKRLREVTAVLREARDTRHEALCRMRAAGRALNPPPPPTPKKPSRDRKKTS